MRWLFMRLGELRHWAAAERGGAVQLRRMGGWSETCGAGEARWLRLP